MKWITKTHATPGNRGRIVKNFTKTLRDRRRGTSSKAESSSMIGMRATPVIVSAKPDERIPALTMPPFSGQ
jgi:hypothetical protein